MLLRRPFSRLIEAHFRPRRRPIRRDSLRLEWLEDRSTPSGATAGQVQPAYGDLPMSFEVNVGQTASQVRYLAQGSGYSLFLTGQGAVLSLTPPAPTPAAGSTPTSTTGVALAMNLLGSNPQATATGLDKLAGTSNYFIGNDPSQWHTNVANYGQVEYQNIYNGINLVYYGNQRQLEYDFVVAPGTHPGLIELEFQGQDGISLDARGDLVLHTASGDVLQNAPVVYQEVNGVREAVTGQFVLLGRNQVGFQIGSYDPSLPLTIDPTLSYSTYLGNVYDDYGRGIAVDSAGSAYLTGYTSSRLFPTTNGAFQTSFSGTTYDTFVTKLNADATALAYSTFIGGNNEVDAYGVAVDNSGNAYITGVTTATNLPVTSGAFQTALAGTSNAFVTKLNATGTALVYSTYLGGNQNDLAGGIAVDSSGSAYIIGSATSTNFPTTAGAFQTSNPNTSGNDSAFVSKLNAAGSALIYSTYLGGSTSDVGYGIAVDGAGNAYVCGNTKSTDFPTTAGAFQTSHATDGGILDGFVSKLNTSGTGLIYSTYLGGNGNDHAQGIAVDAAGDAYVTGYATSGNFPTTAGAFQTTRNGVANGFVTKLNSSGTALGYSTYLGGSGSDAGLAIAVDSAGYAYVAGETNSTNFPTTSGTFQTSLGGTQNTFVTRLNTTGTALLYSTYLGGNSSDTAQGIAVDGSGNAYMTGFTDSSNFPTTTGVYRSTYRGRNDVILAKFNLATPTTTSLSDKGPNPSFQSQAVTFTVQVSPAVPDGELVRLEDVSHGNVVVGTGSLSNASVDITVSSLAVGVHNLVAVYGGDDNFVGSTSSQVAQTVTSLAEWQGYAGTPQHSALSTVGSQPLNAIHWQTPVDLHPQYNGNELLIHYGSPAITTANTVIVPVKTGTSGGFEVEAFDGTTGSVLWTHTTDYKLPPYPDWTPSYSPALTPADRYYFAGNGGTVYYIDNPDSPNAAVSGQIAFFGTANYTANPSAYNGTVFINTPITADSAGNIYFGFQVTGTNPLGLKSGIARIAADGSATWIAAAATVTVTSGNPSVSKVVDNSAPALSNDGSTLYVAVNNGNSAVSNYGYLVELDSTTLAPRASVVLKDPGTGDFAYLPDDGTASPTVGPDGEVYMGVLENPFPHYNDRGWLLQFSGNLAVEKTPGAFGWDDTVSIVPASMIPSYTGSSTYLLMTKYNNYASIGNGDGLNQIAILDPNDSENCPVTGSASMQVMDEVKTILGQTPDPVYDQKYPGAVREWCINSAVVDPATDSVLAGSEDGKLYRWDLTTNSFTQVITLTTGLGEAYTPTLIGADGTVYAINNATLFAVGKYETTTTLTATGPNPSQSGVAANFTGTVTATGGSAISGEKVSIEDASNGNAVVATPTVTNGAFSFSLSSLSVGDHNLFAVYSGDAANSPSQSAEVTQTVLSSFQVVELGGNPKRGSHYLRRPGQRSLHPPVRQSGRLAGAQPTSPSWVRTRARRRGRW